LAGTVASPGGLRDQAVAHHFAEDVRAAEEKCTRCPDKRAQYKQFVADLKVCAKAG
jgi:hypothetical protein